MISTEEGEKLSVLNKEIRFMEKRRKDCKLTHERDLPLAGQIGQTQKTQLLNDQEPTNSFQKNINQKHIQPKIIIFLNFVRASSSHITFGKSCSGFATWSPSFGVGHHPTQIFF